MTHAEALYAYNTYASMCEFMAGMSIALAADCLAVEEVPQLMDLHLETGSKALKACREYGWKDLGAVVEEGMRNQNLAVADIRKDMGKWERQKQR